MCLRNPVTGSRVAMGFATAAAVKAVVLEEISTKDNPETEFLSLCKDLLEAFEEIADNSDLSDEANFFHAKRFFKYRGLEATKSSKG